MWDDFIADDEQSAWTDTAQICLNGHLINHSSEKYPIHNKKHCPECGEPTITICPECNNKISGEIHYPNVFGSSDYKVPVFCSECGKSYPWTKKRIESAKELAAELEELSTAEKKLLEKSIDEISKNNPQANVGATRIKKLMIKVSSSAGDIIKDVITDIASDTAKKVLLGK